MTIWSLIIGFVGGVIAWVFTTGLAQPFQKFIQLRQDVASALAEFEHSRLWTGDPDEEPPPKEWLEKRQSSYERAGVALVAFSISNSFFTGLLHNRCLGSHRCYVRSAGDYLRNLARMSPGTQSQQIHEAVMRQLRLASPLEFIRKPFWKRLLGR
ncbi:hypothetical protein GA0061099_1006163 [Bradyrhizobium yuanmingense]|uniref:Uncharacterized protein n=1 Tax=Bradyrhizobium yuanmingense TaxID=108015 RepID=A0A1C3WIE4_9BRAD|nr:hypothetical protein [Bradyrhizobium yuanmingense]TWI24722.1 hypothetical protein IQ15_04598 [Bradyrhizobium yuanmingense]SCB39514.1 hypothetical protein GA0061099_1006163 [Bradyrhizobium yuanmingense]